MVLSPRSTIRGMNRSKSHIFVRALALVALLFLVWVSRDTFQGERLGGLALSWCGIIAGVLFLPAATHPRQLPAARFSLYSAAALTVLYTEPQKVTAWLLGIIAVLVLVGCVLPQRRGGSSQIPPAVAKAMWWYALASIPGVFLMFEPVLWVFLIGAAFFVAATSYYRTSFWCRFLLTLASVGLTSTWIGGLMAVNEPSSIYIWPLLAVPMGVLASWLAVGKFSGTSDVAWPDPSSAKGVR
ncbi:hypothetical protein DLJ54_07155 [Corynebacterium heidelbergense]|uniref:Uncharacterized protein n=2 Tax=Corynebacterium heidelbergense TaxID=2055947 RepID=A0A364V4W7_9CORY|nr:hypothetical protein DLJ54_07155 [Corynebacterium heidelbergense]